MSEAIDRLLVLAAQAGLTSDDGQWSEAYVHWFRKPMPNAVREAGLAEVGLKHFRSDRTTHTPENEGFIDRKEKIAITFGIGSR